MVSTFWLTAKQHSRQAAEHLAEKGFRVVDMTKRSRQEGVWLTVAHDADEADDVLAIVSRVDPRTVVEG